MCVLEPDQEAVSDLTRACEDMKALELEARQCGFRGMANTDSDGWRTPWAEGVVLDDLM